MAEEPEQMLPQDRRTAGVIYNLVVDDQPAGYEEARAHQAVHQQQDTGGKQHAEGQQTQNGGDKPGPNGQRKPHHGQPF